MPDKPFKDIEVELSVSIFASTSRSGEQPMVDSSRSTTSKSRDTFQWVFKISRRKPEQDTVTLTRTTVFIITRTRSNLNLCLSFMSTSSLKYLQSSFFKTSSRKVLSKITFNLTRRQSYSDKDYLHHYKVWRYLAVGLQDIKEQSEHDSPKLTRRLHSQLPSFRFINHSWYPLQHQTSTKLLQVHLAPQSLPSPLTGSLQSRSDLYLAPNPLPTPFTHAYTSLWTKETNYRNIVWTSVFKTSKSSLVLVYVSFAKSYSFQLGI